MFGIYKWFKSRFTNKKIGSELNDDPTNKDVTNDLTKNKKPSNSKVIEENTKTEKISDNSDIRRANCNLQTKKEPIVEAIIKNDLALVKEEFLKLEDKCFIVGDSKNNLLGYAISKGNVNNEIIDFFLNSGVDYNFQGFAEFAPLHIAAVMNDVHAAKSLLSKKNINYLAKDCEGRTPLEIAEYYGSRGVFNILLVHQKSYKVVKAAGDGSCFFNAVAIQLKAKGKINKETNKVYTAKELRELAVKYILENQEDYQEFLATDNLDQDGDIYVTLDAYIDRMLETTTWADNLVMQAVTNALRINLVIVNHNHDSDTVTTITPKTDVTETIYVQYQNQNHYDAIEFLDDAEDNNVRAFSVNDDRDANDYDSEYSVNDNNIVEFDDQQEMYDIIDGESVVFYGLNETGNVLSSPVQLIIPLDLIKTYLLDIESEGSSPISLASF